MINATNSTSRAAIRNLVCGIALSIGTLAGFAGLSAGDARAEPGEREFIQVISAESAAGHSSMRQYITRNTQSPSLTRVCVINISNRTRTFTHSMPNINALRAGPNGGSVCANFPSGARVHFALFDDGQPVTASRNMVMSLSAFAGGRVDFVWRRQ